MPVLCGAEQSVRTGVAKELNSSTSQSELYPEDSLVVVRSVSPTLRGSAQRKEKRAGSNAVEVPSSKSLLHEARAIVE